MEIDFANDLWLFLLSMLDFALASGPLAIKLFSIGIQKIFFTSGRRGNLVPVQIQESLIDKGLICERILRSLPMWFGIESAILDYIKDVESMPMLTASIGSEIIGFLSLNEHNKSTAEIHVMGVLDSHHRQKVGQSLIQAAEKYLAARNFQYLSVKTLSESRPNKEYDHTRNFYLAMEFVPVEEFKTLWGEHNPCLLLIKNLPKNTGPAQVSFPSMFDPIFLDTPHVKIRPQQSVSWQKLAEGLLYEGSFHGRNWGMKDPEDIRKMYENGLNAFANKKGNPIVFLNHEETEVLGKTNFMNVEPHNKMIEIGGTWIGRKWQRTFVNTETKFALLQYCFETLKLNRVEFRIDSENRPSQNAVQRLGFHFDGLIPRRTVNANGDVRDYVFYSVTDLTWSNVKDHMLGLLEK